MLEFMRYIVEGEQGMTEYEYLKSLPVEEFAKLVVQHGCRYDEDFAFDGVEEYPVEICVRVYQTTDGKQCYSEEYAVEHQIKLLNQLHI